jgi:starch phosphorylase
LPHEWIKRMKRSMQSLGWRFAADRMGKDYVERFYMPAASLTSAETPQNY